MDNKIYEKILNENLIGVNKEAVERHHDFKKSIIRAMSKTATQERQRIIKLIDVIIEENTLIAWHEGTIYEAMTAVLQVTKERITDV